MSGMEEKQRQQASGPLPPWCLAGFLSEAAFPSALASAKVAAGLGAAGGRALEIERFLRHQRLPKANNRGCRLLSLPAAGSAGAAGPGPAPAQLIPKSRPWAEQAGQGCAALVPPETSGLRCLEVALEGAVKLTVLFSLPL